MEKNIIPYLLIVWVFAVLILSFIRSWLRPFAIASTGLLFGIYIVAQSLVERSPVTTMAGMGQGHTVFGQVTEGMDVVNAIVGYDVMNTVRVSE